MAQLAGLAEKFARSAALDLAARPERPIPETFSLETRRLAFDVAEACGKERPELYGRFVDRGDIAHSLLESALDSPDQLDVLAELEAGSSRDWVVRIDLGHVAGPRTVEQLSPKTVFAPTYHWRRGQPPSEETNRLQDAANQAEAAIAAALGGNVDLGRRYDGRADVDLRTDSSLFFRTKGSRAGAAQRGKAAARLLVAAWTTIKLPDEHVLMSVWPEASEWLPIPTLQLRPATSLASPKPGSRPFGRSVSFGTDIAFYTPPEEPMRSVPATAIERVDDSDAASALLSASWHLYKAARSQQSIPFQDREAHARSALDALCEPHDDALNGFNRQRQTTARIKCAAGHPAILSVLDERNFTAAEISKVGSEYAEIRNSAVHRREAARMALGSARASHAGASIHDAGTTTYALALALCQELWSRMAACDFSDSAWESFFEAGAPTRSTP